MKRFAIAICFVLMMMATAALAADITGKWTGEMPGMDGQNMTLTYTFKQDGAKLTGSVVGPMGDPLEIKEGKVEGSKLSFIVLLDMGGNQGKITNEGTIEGEGIKLTTKFEGGDFPPNTLTLKRAK